MNESIRYSIIGGSLSLMVIGIVIVNVPVALFGIGGIGALAHHECKEGY